MKKKLIGLLLVLVFICTACLAACQDNSEAILKNVVFEKNGMTVSSEFVLSAKAGNKNVTWTSDNPAVELVLNSDKTEYVAKINPPEDEQVVVTLTVSLGKATKTFTVKVNPITADDIADEYLFPKKNATVVESFNLETSTEYKGKTATITWSVEDDADKDYIEVKDGKCVVTVSSLKPEVTITGHFTYKGVTVTRNYTFTVSMPMSHLEEVDYWYSETNVGIEEIKGYIIGVAEAYPAKPDTGWISFYMLDEELKTGYYIYRTNIGKNNKAVADKFVPGVYVTVTGTKSTSYNGLWETAQDSGTAVLDESKKINIDENIYSIDNDILANSPATKRHTGALVSLTNWKVKSVAKDPDTDGKTAALILEKEGKTVAVTSSKYMAGFYTYDGTDYDATGKAIANLCKTYNVGDVVSVTGVLSYYVESGKDPDATDGMRLLPRSADDVKKTTADAAGTVYDGVKVGAVLTKINETLTTSGLAGVVTSAKEATLPATQDGVAVAYKLCSSSNAVKLEGTKITVAPSKNEKVNVQVDLTSGTYTTTVFFAIESKLMTDAQIVEAEKTALSLAKDELTKAGSLDLVIEGQVYDNVTIAWALKTGSTLGTIDNTKGTYTVSTLPQEDTEVTLVATITCGEASDTKEFTVTVKAATYTLNKADMKNLEEGKAYALIVDQNNRQETLFATGEWSVNSSGKVGYFAATSTDHTKAAKVYVEKVEDGIKLSFGTGADKKYLGFAIYTDSNSKKQYSLTIGGKVGGDAAGVDLPTEGVQKSEVWVVTEDGKLSITAGTSTNYLGTSGTYNTFSLTNKTDGLFVAYLAEVVDKSPIVKADVNNLQENKAYKLVMNQEQIGKTLYAQGEFNGYYLASTEDLSKSSDIYVEKVDGGVKLYFKDGNNKIYLGVSRSGTYNNVAIDGKVGAGSGTASKDPDAGATIYDVWTITAGGMTIKIDDTTTVCLGTQNDKSFNTFSFRNGATASAAKVFGAYLAEVK